MGVFLRRRAGAEEDQSPARLIAEHWKQGSGEERREARSRQYHVILLEEVNCVKHRRCSI